MLNIYRFYIAKQNYYLSSNNWYSKWLYEYLACRVIEWSEPRSEPIQWNTLVYLYKFTSIIQSYPSFPGP